MSDYKPEVGHRVRIITDRTGVIRGISSPGGLVEYLDDDRKLIRTIPPDAIVTRIPDPELDMSDYKPEVGHRVRIVRTGVVTRVCNNGSFVYRRDSDGEVRFFDLAEPGNIITRLLDPEPDWRPGDVAKDAEGRIVVCWAPVALWHWVNAEATSARFGLIVRDDELARPLTPLVLSGEAVTS